MVGVYLTSQIYALLNHGPAMLNLHTALDSALPVVPVFVIPLRFPTALYLCHVNPFFDIQNEVFPVDLSGHADGLVHQLWLLLLPAE